LFGNGGAGVFHLAPEDENLNALLEMFTLMFREPIIVQRYLPEVRKGDKRIILVDGQPSGGVLRVPQKGEARANFHAGGSAQKAPLTSREMHICEAIGPILRDKGLIFVGIDVIGDYVTEINVTSPTGIQEINKLDDIQIESEIWNAIERRTAHR
jgi:glutathione synthase